MTSRTLPHRMPAVALLLLAGIAFAGFMLFSFLAVFAGYFIYGPQVVDALRNGNAPIAMQKVLLSFSAVGMFVLPPLIFSRLQSSKYLDYLQFNVPRPWFSLLLALAIMLCATPFIEWTIFINQELKLPAFLSRIENWIRYKEIAAEILTRQLLVMKSAPDLLLNLLVIAVIPAIGEELIFRGCLQRIFTDWSGSHHLGIWIAAIVFSAIHFQFFGFLPRMLLGALFGYLLFFTKSIWVPILAHFCNNASAVVMAYVLQKEGKSLEDFSKPSIQNWYLIVLSLIFTAMLLSVLYKVTLENKRDGQ